MSAHKYGVRWVPTWPHISLGVSAHIDRKFGHLSLHLPVGMVVIGFVGDDGDEEPVSGGTGGCPCGHGVIYHLDDGEPSSCCATGCECDWFMSTAERLSS